MGTCVWPLIKPGSTSLSRASIRFVLVYLASISARVPTASIASPFTATAPLSIMRRSTSMVTTVPPAMIRSTFSLKEKVDLIIAGGTVVTMDVERRIIESGAVAVKGDAIEAVGTRAEIDAKYTSTNRIDARDKLVLPGFINGHTHVPMTLLRGLKDDVTLDVWLKNYIFPAEAKNVTEGFVRWGTRLAAAEMIRGGVTTFVDMYYFEDAI